MKKVAVKKAVIAKVAAVKPAVINKEVVIFSRHPTHDALRGKLINKKSTCVRLGSVTESTCAVQINSIEAVRTSSDKRAMKQAFIKAGVSTPKCSLYVRNFVIDTRNQTINWKQIGDTFTLSFPIVLKNRFGSRGTGNTLFKTAEEFNQFVLDNPAKNWDNYIMEEYMAYLLEYRVHASPTINQAFYTCRKALKKDVAEDAKWFRNDENCVWIIEENPEFRKPANWEEICNEAIKATAAVGLDFAACDIRVKAKPGQDGRQEFIIIETNSAPSFGTITAQKYLEVLPAIIDAKTNVKVEVNVI